MPQVGEPAASREDAIFAMVTGWIAHSGPVSGAELASLLGNSRPRKFEQALLRLEAQRLNSCAAHFTGTSAKKPNGATAACSRAFIASLSAACASKFEPVNPAQFMRWLLRWQHVSSGTQLARRARHARSSCSSCRVSKLPPMPGSARFSRAASPTTIPRFSTTFASPARSAGDASRRIRPRSETITGERRRVIPTSVAPITFFVREDADWMIPRRDPEARRHPRPEPGRGSVLQFLRQRGASFFADIVRGTGKLKSEVETALWELVAAGMITADGFDNLRALIDPKRRSGQGSGRTARPRHSAGRWSLLYPGEAVDRAEAARSPSAGCCLRRYGVVFREVLTRETILPNWREVLIALRRLEDRGEIRGGRFVSGFLGEQFALPVAVESLRALRNAPASSETVTVSAADPLNLVGIIVPGERVPANSGKLVGFRDGVAVEPEERLSVLMLGAAPGA